MTCVASVARGSTVLNTRQTTQELQKITAACHWVLTARTRLTVQMMAVMHAARPLGQHEKSCGPICHSAVTCIATPARRHLHLPLVLISAPVVLISAPDVLIQP